MTREFNVRTAILRILERCEPYPQPEPQLRVELDGEIRPPVAQAEFDDALTFLSARKFIDNMPNHIDETIPQWLITEAGKTQLRK